MSQWNATTGTQQGSSTEIASNGGGAVQALREHTDVIRGDLKALGQIAREATAEKLDEAKDAASEYLGQGKDRAMQIEHRFGRYVEGQPIRSMLIAGGLGALLGAIWARR